MTMTLVRFSLMSLSLFIRTFIVHLPRAEDCSDDLDLTGFVEKLKGVLDQVSDSRRDLPQSQCHPPKK